MKKIRSILHRLIFPRSAPPLIMQHNPAYSRYPIGRYTYGYPAVITWGDYRELTIGSFCSFAGEVKIMLGGNHHAEWISTFPFRDLLPKMRHLPDQFQSRGATLIGHDVWVGAEAMILSGVTIGSGAIIGARSVVTGDVPAYSVVAGAPAKVVRLRFNSDVIERLLRIAWWEWPEERIRDAAPSLLCNDVEGFIKRYAPALLQPYETGC